MKRALVLLLTAPPALVQAALVQAALAQTVTHTPPPHGAIYRAALPNVSFGVSVGQTDRLSAHRQAEAACRAAGAACTMVQDFTLPCAAIAEGVVRTPGALFMTSDRSTYRIRAITHGVASNPADAGRLALDACRPLDRGALTCRVVTTQCGPR